ncbi:unnamed protein product [Polarella glacialis]|uniref:Uncharacterized protein n=1 Tax=Polarella glacialis TaxID=89957 RepID=A0A813D716_POLGL|nr:unnamed protein product [Polarella glacialis]
MAPMRKWYFVGQWQVFLGGRHQFNVACREKEVLPEVPEVPWRTSVTPLEFVFLPKDGKKEMPAWSSAQRGSRKVIEHWGRPFRGFTSVVDGSAYLATTHRLPARKKAPDLISWYPCTGDTEEICEWRRHDGVSPQALNVKRKVAEISGSKKGGKRSTGSQKKAPASFPAKRGRGGSSSSSTSSRGKNNNNNNNNNKKRSALSTSRGASTANITRGLRKTGQKKPR